MIVKNVAELSDTDRDISWGNGRSRRYLLERDGMGYTVAETLVMPNTKSLLEYKNHMETCICISGRGRVIDAETGETHDIVPGTMYALNKHDRHYLIADDEEMRLLSIFNPPLTGAEAHTLSDGVASGY